MAESDSWVTLGDAGDTVDTTDNEPVKIGRVSGRGVRLTRVDRAMVRIMNDHGVDLAVIQETVNCQRSTVIATITQTRVKKDDISKDYEVLQEFDDFLERYPPETGGRPTYSPKDMNPKSKPARGKRRKATPEDDREYGTSPKIKSKPNRSRGAQTPRFKSEKSSSSTSQITDELSRPTPDTSISERTTGPHRSSNSAEAVHQFLSGLPLDLSSLQEPLSDLFLDTKEQLLKFARYSEPDLERLFRNAIPGIKETQVFVLVKGLKEHTEAS